MVDHLIRQRDYLLDISRAMTSQLSLKEVLGRILRGATEMLGGQIGLIALAEENSFALRASYGIEPSVLHFFAPFLQDIPREESEGLANPALSRKMKMVARATGLGLRQVVAIPMTIGSELVGVVYIFKSHGSMFTRNDMRLLQSFADQAAIAVHNARLYEQVHSEKQRLDALLRHSADGIMILDPDQRIQSINLAFSRMTGWSVEEAENAQHDDVLRWARREPGLDLNEAIESGWPASNHSSLYVEGDLRQSNGSSLSVGVTYAPLFDADEQLASIIANIRDITRFREAEKAKTTFVSVVSHELKTPISLIKSYASTLNRGDVEWEPDVVHDGLQVIEEEADRLSSLVDNLLDVNRVQFGTLTLRLAPVDLRELAVRLCENFSIQTQEHTLETQFPHDFPLIEADEQRLQQVLANLISNAIKYSPDGGLIEVSGETLSDAVTISVRDNGIGIPLHEQEAIFDHFYRVDNDLARETQGAGLGLYIVRSIVEAHGGHIAVMSTLGQGATFRFTLPLSQH